MHNGHAMLMKLAEQLGPRSAHVIRFLLNSERRSTILQAGAILGVGVC